MYCGRCIPPHTSIFQRASKVVMRVKGLITDCVSGDVVGYLLFGHLSLQVLSCLGNTLRSLVLAWLVDSYPPSRAFPSVIDRI